MTLLLTLVGLLSALALTLAIGAPRPQPRPMKLQPVKPRHDRR